MKVYQVWAESISDVYLYVRADSAEEAQEIADNADGGEFIDSTFGEFRITCAYEIGNEDEFSGCIWNSFENEEGE